MSTIHTNTCTQTTTPLYNHCCDDGVAQQTQWTFLQLIHITDLQMVDKLLKDAADRRCSPLDSVATSLGDKLCHFSLQQGEMFIFVNEQHDLLT